MIARRRHITSSTCNDPRCSFNPLRIGGGGAAVHMFDWLRIKATARRRFNPLLIGEAAPPLSKTSPYHTITLSAEKSDVSAHKDLAARRKTATFHAWTSMSL